MTGGAPKANWDRRVQIEGLQWWWWYYITKSIKRHGCLPWLQGAELFNHDSGECSQRTISWLKADITNPVLITNRSAPQLQV